ncbi:MAG: S8 family serine peptidase [Hyphomonas sp.]
MAMVSPMTSSEKVGEMLSDPQVHRSWYLGNSSASHLSIDIASVWEDYVGTGVKIGVIDSQIDFNHKELRDAYDQGLDYNFALGTGDFSIDSNNMSSSHGTMVAGVISAAAGNGKGSVGLASGATLVGLGIDYSSSSILDQVVAAIRAGAEVDVANNSWSFNTNFADNFQRSAYRELADALKFTAETGRDGLGTSMVFSAGNSGDKGSSNYHNFQNSPYTIAVGAVTASGDEWASTSLGANVLVSAGGHNIYTTSPGNQYAPPSGTSFSAPAVTAVIGLMLEANPDLGYRDIQQILALSARRDGLTDDPLRGDGWLTNGASNFNGGGMHFSDAFGYGFVNAHDAVRLAETWTQQQTADNRDTITITENIRGNLVAGSQDHLSFEVDVTDQIEVEHVQLSMDLRWKNTGDLDIYLTSPDGTTVRLVYDLESGSYVGAVRDFSFTSVASMGELGAGSWTVDIYNRNPNATNPDGSPMSGFLDDITLTLHGDMDEFRDDTYVYTDEFARLYSGSDLAQRSILNDTDGGVDAINAAAVTSNSQIDLSDKGVTKIAGVTLDIRNPGQIENIFSGDGNDRLRGNAADNLIEAGRGNDTLQYSAGDDTLNGGSGTDTLQFFSLFATVTGYFTQSGTFMLGLVDSGLSTVIGIERFVFNDVTYTFSQLKSVFSGSDEPPSQEPPADAPAVAEPPADEPLVQDPPTQAPPAAEPPVQDPPANEPSFDEVFNGTSGADRLRASQGNDDMSGAGGNDRLFGFAGDDRMHGDAGDDRLKGGSGHDKLFGDGGVDKLYGEAGNDTLKGGAGNDKLVGGTGDDVLMGGAGRDVMIGGEGADTFYFDLSNAGDVDIIRDFSATDGDQIVVTGLNGAGDVEVELFTKGTTTFLQVDTGDEIIRLAKIDGDGVSSLSINQLSDDILFFV